MASYKASNKLLCSCNQAWNLKCGSALYTHIYFIWGDCFILILYGLPHGSKEKASVCVCAASKINKSSRWNSYNATYLSDSRRWIPLLCKPVPVQIDGFFLCVCSWVWALMCYNWPSVKISQRRMPYDHTSLRVVYKLWKMLSGAIHFRGRNVWMTEGNRELFYQSTGLKVQFAVFSTIANPLKVLCATCYLASVLSNPSHLSTT